MQRIHKPLVSLILGLLVVLGMSVQAQAQQPLFLHLGDPDGFPIIPVLEGWVANADGTTSFSFGIINRNDEVVEIPLGARNYIEPAKWNGVQPTYFPPGRSTGVFAVNVPNDEREIDVWWHLLSEDGEDMKVPGRWGSGAYELDFILPRPQGSRQPEVGLGADGDLATGLTAHHGNVAGGNARVGTPVAISVNVNDPSERDPSDPRFGEPLDVGVEFQKWQGPGDVEFTRHESTVVAENPYEEDNPRFRFFREPGVNSVNVEGGTGVATVYATFSAPGDYIISTKVNNFAAPESSNGDQCCWSNVYQHITVR